MRIHSGSGPKLLSLTVLVTLLSIAPGASSPAQADFSDDEFSAYSTGTVVHADAIEDAGSGTRVADVEVAFSGAAADSTSEGVAPRLNEVDRAVVPGSAGGEHAYARGSGLEVGAGVTADDDNQVILAGEAEATPSNSPSSEEIGPVSADPVAYASLLKGHAEARWSAECVVGADIARGLGYANDTQLLDQDGTPDAEGEDAALEQPVVATDTTNPNRAVSQSTSRVTVVAQIDGDGDPTGRLGVMSETRMTIAPLTLLRGPAGEGSAFTVEFLGEWVLRAVAFGNEGFVHYGPGAVEPETPVVRVIDEATGEIETLLTTQDILGNDGLVVEVPEAGIEIALGEDARAIGGNAESKPTEEPTTAAGAVDVARIRLLDVEGTGSVADLRVGHMEARVQVPPEGIDCSIDVTKDVDERVVSPGDEFTYTIVVSNPLDGCTLEHVEVVDRITATEGVTWEVIGQDPPADSVSNDTVVWNDVGPLAPGGSKTLSLRVRVGDDSAEGRFTDDVVATSACGVAGADGSTEVMVPVSANANLPLPEVVLTEVAGKIEPQGAPSLPRTGGTSLPAALGIGLAGAAVALRQLRRWGASS